MAERYFTRESFTFLKALVTNNNSEWFAAHKQDYEVTIRTPALAFISAMANDLSLISPHFLAVPKKVGGSLMRVYRDVRFGKDKRPYKTNIGIQFRHEVAKDVHAPGYYVHIDPDRCFVGVGIWRPDSSALGKIRDAIVAKGQAWRAASGDKAFRKYFVLDGESLTNPPRGYAKDHPLISDLKRKDFIAVAPLAEKIVISENFRNKVCEQFTRGNAYMQFLCKALELRF